MRIDKLLAHCGYGSRKDVKQLLKDGLVTSNGKKIRSSGAHVDPEKDEIYVGDEKINYSNRLGTYRRIVCQCTRFRKIGNR